MAETVELLRQVLPEGEEYASDPTHDALADLVSSHIHTLSPRQIYLQGEVAVALYRRRPEFFETTAPPITVLWPTDPAESRFSAYHVVAYMAAHDSTNHLNLSNGPPGVAVICHEDMAQRSREILLLAGYKTTLTLTTGLYSPVSMQSHTRTPLRYRLYDYLACIHMRLFGGTYMASIAPQVPPKFRIGP